jgi:general secretion pathway protein D
MARRLIGELRMVRSAVVVILVVSSLARPRPAVAQPAPEARAAHAELPSDDDPQFHCKRRTADVMVTFKAETEIKDLVAWAMGFTCKNFILDPRITSTGRKVSIVVPNKLSAADAYNVFLAAISTVGLTVVPRGNVHRIVEAAAARKESLGVKRGMPGDVEQVVRYVYQPSYLAIEAMQQACAAMKSEAGDVIVVGRVLLITDYANRVREMLSFARLVDVPAGSDAIYTVPVLHADATRLMEKLHGILSLQGAAAPARPGAAAPPPAEGAAVPSKIVVDERTNTLIIAASEPGYQRVRALVERLDIALEIEGGNSIHVYPLGSAIAEELAKTLTAAIGDSHAKPTTGAPGAAPATAPSPLASLGTTIEGQVRVIADSPTNSLIVLSSGRDFFAIKDVIKQLDLPRRQVYIEALILEVNATNNTEVGTSGHAGKLTDTSALLLGGIETSDVNSITIADSLGGATGLLGGLIGKAFAASDTLLGRSFPSFAVLFHAVADQSNTNVISAPSIIAIDNVEAKYKIGTAIPVDTGTVLAGIGGGALPPSIATNRIEYKELPLILNIKPHISHDDTVLLEVKHESLDKTGDGLLGPTWSTRAFETRVVVDDQQTVVLGGLTQDKEIEKTTKVPVLGDIPLLGYLFKTTSKQRSRTNLLIMLTPYIIKDQRELQAIQRRKMHQHDEFARSSSALDRMKFEPTVDYGRKRGLLEDINLAVQDAERDEAARAELPRPRGVEAGRVDPRPTEPTEPTDPTDPTRPTGPTGPTPEPHSAEPGATHAPRP